jgi:glycosyltransferase involved in cell wall biosynthesis
VTKFVKYLPEFGWESSVLTVSNPSVPLQDESLNHDISSGTIIRRARTYEPGYALKQAVSASPGQKQGGNVILRTMKSIARNAANLVLQPDAQVLWHPQAFRAGAELLESVKHDAIITTCPPFSSLLLGARLAKVSGLPLILDYRDEWDISSAYWENKSHGRLTAFIQSRQQARVLRAADAVLATTPSSAAAIGELAKSSGSRAICRSIYNGFDSDDYATAAPIRPLRTDHRFRLAFIGTLWNLNSILPVVEALIRLAETQPQLAAEVELLLAGRRTPDQEAILDRLAKTPITLKRLPFVSHAEAIDLMRSADSLLMLNSDLPKTQRIINAKTFEYMAARRPMIVVAPQGDVWDIVRNLPGTLLSEPSRVDVIASHIALAVERHRCGVDFQDAAWEIGRFERRNLAGELAQLLDETIGASHFRMGRVPPRDELSFIDPNARSADSGESNVH